MTAGCARLVPSWQWLCRPCFEALPFHDRKAIAVACQEKKPGNVIFGLCRAAAEWLAAHRAEAAER